MNESAEIPIQTPQQLKQDWSEHKHPKKPDKTEEGPEDMTEQEEKQAFDSFQWLKDYYNFFYEEGSEKDSELSGIAREILGEMKQEVAQDSDHKKAIEHLDATLATQDEEAPSEDGRIRKFLKPVLAKVGDVRTKIQFERVLVLTESKKQDQQKELSGFAGDAELQASTERVEKEAKKIDSLSEEQKESAVAIRAVLITPDDIKKSLVEAEIAHENGDILNFKDEFEELQNEMEKAFSSSSPRVIAETLARHQSLIANLDTEDSLKTLLSRVPHLARATPSQWRRQKEGIKEQLMSVVHEKSLNKFLIDTLILQGEYEENLHEQIDSLAGLHTAYARLFQADQEFASLQIPKDVQKTISAFLLEDLSSSGEIPAILVEDVITGRMTTEEMGAFILYDWMKTEIADEGLEGMDEKAKAEVLAKALNKLKAGLRMTALLLAVASLPLAAINSAFKSDIKLPFEGGGANLDMGNPFEGVSLLGNRRIFKVEGFDEATPLYFRLRSSEEFDLYLGWEDHLKTVAFDIEVGIEAKREDGVLEGSKSRQKNGDYWIPVPYGYDLRSYSGDLYDKKSDGSVCVDLDRPADVKGKRIAVELFESTKGRMEYRDYIRDPNTKRVDRFPWGENSDAGLQPLISSADVLPQSVLNFLGRLDDEDLTKKEEAEKIIAYVADVFVYSLDPKNKEFYDAAKKKGLDGFMNTVFEEKKVKCDGAATAAIALLRLRGIPSRLANGYMREVDSDEITASDAHAWVEYMADGELYCGDPTPDNMDEVTKKIISRSNFIKNAISRFKSERYKAEDYSGDFARTMSLVTRVLGDLPSSFARFDIERAVDNFKKATAPARVGLRQKMENRIAVLRQLTQDQDAVPELSSVVIEKLEQREVMTEELLRRMMLNDNLRTMLPELIDDLTKDLFPDGIPMDEAFMEKWGLRHVDIDLSDRVGREVVKDNIFTTGEASIRNEEGQFTSEYIMFLQNALRKELHRKIMSREHNAKGSQSASEWQSDKEIQAGKYSNLITLEVIASHPLAEVYASYIQAVQVLNSDESTVSDAPLSSRWELEPSYSDISTAQAAYGRGENRKY